MLQPCVDPSDFSMSRMGMEETAVSSFPPYTKATPEKQSRKRMRKEHRFRPRRDFAGFYHGYAALIHWAIFELQISVSTPIRDISVIGGYF